jgi:glycosyltransferase involved in cell wall biosynthesis
MRILTFTSLFPDEVRPEFGIFVYQRVAGLARRTGHQVRVMAPVPYFPAWLPIRRWRPFSQVPKAETVGTVSVVHPRYLLLPGMMPLHGLLIFLGCVLEASRLHRSYHFDCIDAHYVYPDGFAAVLLGKVLGIPVFLSARGTDINVFPVFHLIRPMIRWALSRAAGVIAVSAALKELMVGIGVPAEKIQVIANGVDAQRFHRVDRVTARRELKVPQDTQVIVSVGSLVPGKSHTLLITAMTELAKRDSNLRLYIVGEGPMRPRLSAFVSKKGLQERVFLVGSQPNENLKLWFSAADVSCLASLREGMPNVVLESLACGTPVVATRVGGVAEVLVSEKLGVLVEPSAEGIIGGLERALHGQWDRNFISAHARARTWDVVAEEVERYLLMKCEPTSSRRYAPK